MKKSRAVQSLLVGGAEGAPEVAGTLTHGSKGVCGLRFVCVKVESQDG